MALLNEYSAAVRYLFLLVCGFATSLIFGAIVGYTYSDGVVSVALGFLSSPISSSEGLYAAIGDIVRFSRFDTFFILIAFVAGMTYLCRAALSALNLIRGFLLGLIISVYSASAALSLSAVFVVAELILASVIIVFFASFAERASEVFSNRAHSGLSVAFSKSFFSYFTLFMICLGATVLLRIVLSLIL